MSPSKPTWMSRRASSSTRSGTSRHGLIVEDCAGNPSGGHRPGSGHRFLTRASTFRCASRVEDVNRSLVGGQPAGRAAPIELNIRRTPGGLGTDGWVFKSLQAGDTVQITGPYGRFFFGSSENSRRS